MASNAINIWRISSLLSSAKIFLFAISVKCSKDIWLWSEVFSPPKAFGFVARGWSPGDKVLTLETAVCVLPMSCATSFLDGLYPKRDTNATLRSSLDKNPLPSSSASWKVCTIWLSLSSVICLKDFLSGNLGM